MSYLKAAELLPSDLLEKIQKYVNGTCIYIPRTAEERLGWGTRTPIRKELEVRNGQIYSDYREGISMDLLAKKYFLSVKSIQRIIRQEKNR